jgi:hypothetical protein
MAQQWLKCRVSEGMFSNERVIVFRGKGNDSIEEFVPADMVEVREGQEGRVRVFIVTRDDGPWAILPTPYSKTVPIDKEQLEIA